jgi:transglutaminase-like putative cysteine protease
MKGPLGSLLDQGGAAWDQCSLLVALLTQAGYTAEFVLGQIKLTTAQFDAWFGTDSLINSYCCYYYAQNANIPCDTPTETGGVWSMIMAHVWVQVVVGENTYVLDPSYKTYTRTSPISDLGTIMDYTQSGFLTDAESGATVDGSGNFVQNMNAMNIATDLKNYTANLVSYINDNTVGAAPPGTAGVDDILGGKAIVPITLPFTC